MSNSYADHDHDGAIALAIGIKDLAEGVSGYLGGDSSVAEGRGASGTFQLIYFAVAALADYLNKIDLEGLSQHKQPH